MYAFEYTDDKLVLTKNGEPVTYNKGMIISIPFKDYDESPSVKLKSLMKIIRNDMQNAFNLELSNASRTEDGAILLSDYDAENLINHVSIAYSFNDKLVSEDNVYRPLTVSQWINSQISILKQAFNITDLQYAGNVDNDGFSFVITDEDAERIVKGYSIIGTGIDA